MLKETFTCGAHSEQLFRTHPSIISHIQHVLIDEFQDTNTVQYQIMRLLAHRGAVTIVGDPDQGIYGFRYAQAVNLKKMIEGKILLDCPSCKL